MAKYTADPGYTVRVSKTKKIEFDRAGKYETTVKGEIAVLDRLAPRYITKVAEKQAVNPKGKPASGN